MDILHHFASITPFELDKIRNYIVGDKYALIELIDGNYGVCGVGKETVTDEIPERIDLKIISHRILYICYLNALFNCKYNQNPTSSFVENISPEQFPAIVMIGLFKPVLKKYNELGIKPIVFDIIKDSDILTPLNQQEKYLKNADLVIITGTTIANNSFSEIISKVSLKAKIVILGPSTLLHPDIFVFIPNAILSGMVFKPNQPELKLSIKEGRGTRYFKRFGKKVDIYPN